MKDAKAVGRPLISLIVSMYGVERYLRAFLASLDAQGTSLSSVEVLFIDDGSPDESADIADLWLASSGARGRVIRKPNGGLSSARNRGIEEASGTWVSFPDPDDVLGVDYLRVLKSTVGAISNEVGAVAGNIIYLDDPSGAVRDTHPLRPVFSDGPRVIDLSNEPQAVKLQAASTLFRRQRIVDDGLEFDHRVRPNFEDGAFMMRYQAGYAAPRLAVVPQARYYYRQRSDSSSLVASSWSRREKYTDLPRFGWLETLRAVADADGRVPAWAQNIVLYDMHWYFRYDTQIHTPTRSIEPAVREEFMRLVRETLAYIDAETIIAYSLTKIRPQERLALIALRGDDLPRSVVDVWRRDRFRPLIQLKYFFSGSRPSESFGGSRGPIEPAFAKDRAVVYFGETVMHERILWLPADDALTVALDGSAAQLRPYSPGETLTTSAVQDRTPGSGRADDGEQRLTPPRPTLRARTRLTREAASAHVALALARLERMRNGRSKVIQRSEGAVTKLRARRGAWRAEFRAAWVFMDRDTQAQDNAEHLYRWVRNNRPEVNAWFVLRPSSSDWARLDAEGFRLVEFGTMRHTALLKNARHLISSHVDHYVVHPWNKQVYGAMPWAYTFLQHGVTKDDISRWLAGKPIDMLVTAAPAEHASFTTDGTPYVLTDRETKLTGFPRHDALLAKSTAHASDKDLILVMPTWREYLMTAVSGRGNHRDLIEGFDESEYVTSWAAYLSDPDLGAYAAANGLRIAFVPHPNLEAHVHSFHLPDGVEILTYGGTDVQEAIARARVLVTDYSSLAFEAGYIGTPVVYFQFDRADFFTRHPHRPGYFDYEVDGFGPVALDARDAARASIAQLEGSGAAAKAFADRAVSFFLQRDGRNCERTYDAIAAIRRRE